MRRLKLSIDDKSIQTYSGAKIKRSKYGVGKDIGGSIFFHKNYADAVVPKEILRKAVALLQKEEPGFKYRTLVYSAKAGLLRFDEAPDFDVAREPIPGKTVTVDYIHNKVGEVKTYDSIWHHKWLWVKDDYTGFDVEESKDWSRTWTQALEETAKGRASLWQQQLQKYGLK